jgi:polyisoprenoid-binding protein YceI
MSTLATPQTSSATWNIDPAHTVAEFKVKHMTMSSVKGQFAKVTGWLALDKSHLKNSRFEAWIEASIETRDAQRDSHLRSADSSTSRHFSRFPSVLAHYPGPGEIRDGELAVEGDFTIRGVTRELVFTVEEPTPPAKDPWGGTRVAVSATTNINHKDFGLSWNAALETGGILIGDEVTITLDVSVHKSLAK